MERSFWGGVALFLGLFVVTVALWSTAEYRETAAVSSDATDRYPDLHVQPPASFVEPEQKTVYLTFDDGPTANTEALLDLLARDNIKATFFVCSPEEEDGEFQQVLLRRMRDEGHTIGLHSFTHQEKEIYTSLDHYLTDLAKIDAFVYKATGLHCNIIRFVGGSATIHAKPALMGDLAREVTERGYVYYDWTVVSGDDGPTTLPAAELKQRILRQIEGRQIEIILCHDGSLSTSTPGAVADVIDDLREQGYAFDRLTHETPPVQLFKAES